MAAHHFPSIRGGRAAEGNEIFYERRVRRAARRARRQGRRPAPLRGRRGRRVAARLRRARVGARRFFAIAREGVRARVFLRWLRDTKRGKRLAAAAQRWWRLLVHRWRWRATATAPRRARRAARARARARAARRRARARPRAPRQVLGGLLSPAHATEVRKGTFAEVRNKLTVFVH